MDRNTWDLGVFSLGKLACNCSLDRANEHGVPQALHAALPLMSAG